MGAGIRKRIDVNKLDRNSVSLLHKGPSGQITQAKRKNIDLTDLMNALDQIEKNDPVARVVKRDAEKGKQGLMGFFKGLGKGFKEEK